MAKYSVHQQPVETLLTWIKSGEIAIPEIQRPFVWNSTKVRDLIDSLYKGYPVGYIITWRNPNVKLKDGSISEGKKILIDGQQRITALTSSILGQSVLDKQYSKKRIKIAFHPNEERFEVLNPAISKDKEWLPDIYPVITGEMKTSQIRREYVALNPEASEDELEDSLDKLKSILNKQIGIIELDHSLDIDTVTDIFIRINSKGVVLSQADFVMSKIASDERFGGNMLRKCIDYFCHIYNEPGFIQIIGKNDSAYSESEYFKKIKWIANSSDELYKPEYQDLLRVAFTYKFNRGKFADLVSLLSGRNFETRTYEDEIAEESFSILKEGIFGFINQTNFERFVMCIQSAGFIKSWMIRSQNALNFSYVIYLKLKNSQYPQNEVEHLVKKWFVMASITNRYSGSAESWIDYDIKQIEERGVTNYLQQIETAVMGEGFWTVGLVDNLNTSSTYSSAFIVYLASQVKSNKRGFLSKDITVRDMIQHRGDLHHLFPKDILKKAGLAKNQYNQVANIVYAQQEINIQIGKSRPNIYMDKMKAQCENGQTFIGNIKYWDDVKENLIEHDIPADIFLISDTEHYNQFLEARRKMMAKAIEKYYLAL